LQCTSQVLDALAYAHARGVVHRDIKPANIMRTPAGTVKLMDFGIARMQADRQLTKTGTTVGSLFYMSPEQINGGQPDSRSDLYSLGVTLYEMVTGRRPFGGDSDYSIMAAHLQKAPVAPMEIVAI
jgi:serine/threonine protein kinase